VKTLHLTARTYFHRFGNMEPNAVVGSLAALAQKTRLEIYRVLVQAGPDGLPAGSIAARLSLPLPTLSFHLAQLKHAGLVTARRQSRSIIYAANYTAMNGLIAYLTENCCGGAGCLPASASPSPGVPRHEALPRARRR
jgi:ArsR family transcriptional regulator, arsenate/arsenite/antimonite-responsive transcriptional repressor